MSSTADSSPTAFDWTWAAALLRRGLDRIYLVSGYLAALSIAGIFLITLAQIGARQFDIPLRGSTDYAGYLMAASAFFGFAHALNRGAQIRIELFLQLSGRARPLIERLAFLVSTLIAAWFAYHCWMQVIWSYRLDDVSQGLDATPLWIPQLSMAIGASLLSLAVADHSLRLLFTGRHDIPEAPDAT